jgi:hypothetical protein
VFKALGGGWSPSARLTDTGRKVAG